MKPIEKLAYLLKDSVIAYEKNKNSSFFSKKRLDNSVILRVYTDERQKNVGKRNYKCSKNDYAGT